MRGAVWVAYGDRTKQLAAKSLAGFREHNRVSAAVLDDVEKLTGRVNKAGVQVPEGLSTDQLAHFAKTTVNLWSPFDLTLMIDADTTIKGSLEIGFSLLRRGWDLVVVPSSPPGPAQVPNVGRRVLWHLNRNERDYTISNLGLFAHVMYNSGILFFAKTPRIEALFDCWRREWLRFKDRDQGALLRALDKHPVKMFLLGSPFNSIDGEVVEHNFGKAR